MKTPVDEVVEALQMLSDPERRSMSATYFPTSMEVIGVTNPELKKVIKEMKLKYKEWTVDKWIQFCIDLVETGYFECQALAYELIGRDKKILSALSSNELGALAKNLDNWASVDGFSVGIYGVLWGKGVVKDGDIRKLLKSDDHWQRRVAVVSTVALNLKSRGGTGDTPRTLWVCEAVVDDHHDMIQKALSWALRELSKRDREAVISFLGKYEKRVAKRVLREVNHKLEFGTKN
jgi:3-methyladenine DNA glycosylase AlkD